MTVRKLWLLILIGIVILSVVINAFILSTLTDKYFKDYMTESYNNHVNQIIKYSKKAISEDDFSIKQMAIELETHLDDPITHIKLYDSDSNLLVDVRVENNIMNNEMMDNHMMMRRMMNTQSEQVDYFDLLDNDKKIGQINITRYSSAENSVSTHMFKASLLTNSLYSIVIAVIISLIIGFYISKKMNNALISTANMAKNIILKDETQFEKTNIYEISIIQRSLEELKTRLKLKQKSRKTLIDELVHQTRTPLTILKTHLEGFADEVIEITPEEIKICENQIENITTIISNMSQMIDAQKDIETINVEEFEFSSMVKQITNGLKAQFNNREIQLLLETNEKVNLITDRYKLSQVIYNIITNAYKYTNRNGHVYIRYKTSDDMLIIQIQDDGIGIKKENLNRIFEAYFQEKNIDVSNGEGIGLYIVKENLEMIKGNIEVTSEVNKGSCFTITIPKKIEIN